VFIATNAAVLALRKERIAEAHFHTPTALPVLAILACLLLLAQQSGETWLRAGLLLGLGALLYGVGRRRARRVSGG